MIQAVVLVTCAKDFCLVVANPSELIAIHRKDTMWHRAYFEVHWISLASFTPIISIILLMLLKVS